jgi:hypothetical protein
MDARDVLFTKTQQRILGALFADGAGPPLTYSELLHRTEGGSGAIHRELKQLVASGLVTRGRAGYAPNPRHPVYPELVALADKLLAGEGENEPRLEPLHARRLARRYLWWKSPREALADQRRLVAAVMNGGTFDDWRVVATQLGDGYLRDVIRRAEPGEFEPRAWAYWHHRLDLARPSRVPPLPRRQIA